MSTIYLYLKKHLFQRRFFYLILCTALVCPMLLLTGCQNATGSDTATGKKPISINSIKLNTAVQITIYDSQDKSLLDDCLALCDKYELIFSRTNENKTSFYKIKSPQRYIWWRFQCRWANYSISGQRHSRHLAYIRRPCLSAFRRARYHQGIRWCLWHRYCAFDLSLGFHSRRPEGSGWCRYSESSPSVQLWWRNH